MLQSPDVAQTADTAREEPGVWSLFRSAASVRRSGPHLSTRRHASETSAISASSAPEATRRPTYYFPALVWQSIAAALQGRPITERQLAQGSSSRLDYRQATPKWTSGESAARNPPEATPLFPAVSLPYGGKVHGGSSPVKSGKVEIAVQRLDFGVRSRRISSSNDHAAGARTRSQPGQAGTPKRPRPRPAGRCGGGGVRPLRSCTPC